DLDHVATIGPTLEDIAREKAGVIRPGVPVVTGAYGAALEVVRSVAAARGAPLLVLEDGDPLFSLRRPPRLRGEHQVTNARLACAALRLLGYAQGADNALDASWPGRLEEFRLGGTTVIVDGAHNPAGALAAAAAVPPGYVLVFGAMARKDVLGVLGPLARGARSLHLVSPGEGGSDPRELRAAAGGSAHSSLAAALDAALADAGPGTVLVAGSLYLAGTARRELLARGAESH
ncbi:MAG TPA: cyanophycin synthetase, partial [Deinococcales bacterium]|nr:cyanophycin synthetase [Deinococcales bacterium]